MLGPASVVPSKLPEFLSCVCVCVGVHVHVCDREMAECIKALAEVQQPQFNCQKSHKG